MPRKCKVLATCPVTLHEHFVLACGLAQTGHLRLTACMWFSEGPLGRVAPESATYNVNRAQPAPKAGRIRKAVVISCPHLPSRLDAGVQGHVACEASMLVTKCEAGGILE